MNWIQGIQRAIDYVEANITEELDFDDVARQAFSSPFHFQRVFSMLCCFSLGDYIRMRRLSLAGEELSDEAFQEIVDAIEEAQPDLEIDAHRGEQPLYPVIFSIE